MRRVTVTAAAVAALLSFAFVDGIAATRPNASGAPAQNELDGGRRVFTTHCQPCHPGGNAGVGPSLKLKPVGSFRLKTQVRMGKGKMPAFTPSQIDRDDLQRLVAYLQTLPATNAAPARGKAKRP
jgi:mono/diheme cytochrome c family protein